MHGSQHLGVRLIQNKQVDGRMDRWMGGWQVTSVATTRQVGLYWLCTGLGVRQGAIRHQSKSSRGAIDAFLAGAAEQTACPHGAAGAHVRWPGFDAVGGGVCPADARSFPGPFCEAGSQAHFLWCGKLQRLFCQETERLHEYFIRGCCAGLQECLAGSPGSWELCAGSRTVRCWGRSGAWRQ